MKTSIDSNACDGVAIKLYHQKQIGGQIWPMKGGWLASHLEHLEIWRRQGPLALFYIDHIWHVVLISGQHVKKNIKFSKIYLLFFSDPSLSLKFAQIPVITTFTRIVIQTIPISQSIPSHYPCAIRVSSFSNLWSIVLYPYSIVFARVSYKQNHIVCNLSIVSLSVSI